MIIMPHKLNIWAYYGKVFLLWKKRFLHFAFPVISRKFVWQQTELRFSCVVPFGAAHFLFPEKCAE